MTRKDWTNEKLLFRLINNKSDKTYWDNIKALRQKPTREVFNKSIELTKSKNVKEREIGIDILAQLGNRPRPFCTESNKRFFELLEIEKEPKLLMSLLYAIGHNNERLTKVEIEKLCSFSDNDNKFIKEGLVSSLLGLDNLYAIETLIKLSTDKISHIRNWATFGIGSQIERNNKNIREALWNRINDKHQETKFEAIAGLAKRKDSRINDVIKHELLNGKFGTLLFEAIIETRDKIFLPLLQQNLESVNDDFVANPEWTKDLKNCINELTKLTN